MCPSELADRLEEAPEQVMLGAAFDSFEPLPAHNTLALSGWALAPSGIASVKVRIAGREITASHGLPAPDWLTDLPDWPDGGFPWYELRLDTSTWERGEHRFEIVATDRSGNAATLTGSADVQPYELPPVGDAATIAALTERQPTMWCERPDIFDRREARLPVEIHGWASSPAGVAAVMVTVDGTRRIAARHGLVRPDLTARFGTDLATDGGFAVRLDPGECPAGWHELTIVAVMADGRGLGVSGTVNCLAAPTDVVAPDGVVDQLPASRPADEEDDEGLMSGERFVPYLHRGRSLEPEHYARYLWAAPLVAGGRVLDAGCGVGWGTALLAGHATEAVGMDLAPPMVALATRHFGDRAEYVEGDLLELPFDDDAFDAVVCFEAIEHVAAPEQALDQMRRVLRPDGLLLVSTPNLGPYPAGNPFHLREFTSSEFEAVLGERFSNVATFRQHPYVASLLGPDAALELDDPAAELDAVVAKVVGGPPGSELYAVAAASDGDLPPLAAQIVLGAGFDHQEQRRLMEMWQERTQYAEAEAATLRNENYFVRRQQEKWIDRAEAAGERVAELERRLARADAERASMNARHQAELDAEVANRDAAVWALRQSLSWRLTRPLRAARRASGAMTRR